MGKEQNLWQRLKPHLDEAFFCTRVENMVADGMPDVDLTCRKTGRQLKVELKSVPALPKRDTTRVFGDGGLRASQVAWIYGRAIVGSPIWIVASGPNKELWCVHGRYARLFNDFTVTDLHPYLVPSYASLVQSLSALSE